jgi:hypothetical protein
LEFPCKTRVRMGLWDGGGGGANECAKSLGWMIVNMKFGGEFVTRGEKSLKACEEGQDRS